MEEEEESSVSELTEAETVESPGEVADDAGLLKVGFCDGKGVRTCYVRERFFCTVLSFFPPDLSLSNTLQFVTGLLSEISFSDQKNGGELI
jgi:hypothetical protein